MDTAFGIQLIQTHKTSPSDSPLYCSSGAMPVSTVEPCGINAFERHSLVARRRDLIERMTSTGTITGFRLLAMDFRAGGLTAHLKTPVSSAVGWAFAYSFLVLTYLIVMEV